VSRGSCAFAAQVCLQALTASCTRRNRALPRSAMSMALTEGLSGLPNAARRVLGPVRTQEPASSSTRCSIATHFAYSTQEQRDFHDSLCRAGALCVKQQLELTPILERLLCHRGSLLTVSLLTYDLYHIQ
jgi:hypothetical protein